MSASEQAALYRRHAIKCIELARRSADSETRLALFDMARSWRALASHADKNSEIATLVYETPEPRQHVAQQQQQQQPQPESDKTKEE
jgi:hypothetical protein